MKLADIDWRVMRGSAIFLTVAILASGTLVSGGHVFGSKMKLELQKEQRKLNAIRTQYQTIDEQRQIIEQSLPNFRTLEAKGIVGEERRLEWIETIRVAAAHVQVSSLRYQIGSRNDYTPYFPTETQGFNVYASEMKLDMGLLHEEDLLSVLREVNRRTTSLYEIAYCSLTRAGPSFENTLERPNLRASCGLRWLTLQLDAKPT